MRRFLRKRPHLTFKFRIILIFSIINILIVLSISRMSYYFIRKIYSNQLSEQIHPLLNLVSRSIETNYLMFLLPDNKESQANVHFKGKLRTFAENLNLPGIFIFNKDFQILAHSSAVTNSTLIDPALVLNRNEILGLAPEKSVCSLPFKGEDRKWYMWGFYRLSETHWLCVQENAHRLSQVERFSLFFWLFGLLGTLLTFFAGWFIARMITKPVNELVEFSELIGRGEFGATIPEKIQGELQILAKALDRMRNDLSLKQKEKEEILAQIAHEIRNPLGGIELFAGLVKEDLSHSNMNTQYISRILDEVAGLKSLITSYLSYSRPLLAQPEKIEVRKIINEIKDLYDKEFRTRRVAFEFRQNGGSNCVLFDRNHFRQVLINLIANSLEAVKEDGKIQVEPKSDKEKAYLLIKDNGPGIKDGEIDDIFKPFFTTKKGGTGLGLAICRKLCTENNAEITVKNNKEKGCEFTISISKCEL